MHFNSEGRRPNECVCGLLNFWLPCDFMLVSNWSLQDSPPGAALCAPGQSACLGSFFIQSDWFMIPVSQSHSPGNGAVPVTQRATDTPTRTRSRQKKTTTRRQEETWRQQTKIRLFRYAVILLEAFGGGKKKNKGAWTGAAWYTNPAAGKWQGKELH